MDNHEDSEVLKTLQKHWCRTALITDMIRDFDYEKVGKKVGEEDLLPGESAAIIFQIGCYTVRIAHRYYRMNGSKKGTPANKEDLRSIKTFLRFGGLSNQYHITNEISVRHNANPNGAFTYICSAPTYDYLSFFATAYITDICTAKKIESDSDGEAHLFIAMRYSPSSDGSKTWYKFDPKGNIKTLNFSKKARGRFVMCKQEETE